MSNLIIHPRDNSTTFLSVIYENIPDKTVITHGVTKRRVRELIKEHDRVIMLGHGSPGGLLSMRQFGTTNGFIIDYSMVEVLKEKKENIYIWCNADQFVERNGLEGLFSGMFISEIEEAWYYNFHDLERNTIEESNFRFVDIVSRYIDQPMPILYNAVLQKYGLLARTNQIAKFNLERLYLRIPESPIYSKQLDNIIY